MRAITRRGWGLRRGAGLCMLSLTLFYAGCAGTCPVITRLDAEPQWVCPGADFSAKIHMRIENFDEDGDPSADGTCLWQLWETSQGAPTQPGAVNLTSTAGALNNPSPGVHETPASGVPIVGVPQARSYRFSLIASNTDCPDEGEQYLREHRAEIEEKYGVDLDDNAVMTAHTEIELIQPGPKRICARHVEDVQSGFTWVTEEVRAGQHIVIDGVDNPHGFDLVVEHTLAGSTRSTTLAAGASTATFDGRSPNGRWSIRAVNSADYDAFIQSHKLSYTGKASICIDVRLRCE